MAWNDDDGEFDTVNELWKSHQTLRTLEQLADSDPELFRSIVNEHPNAAELLKNRNSQRIEELKKRAEQSLKKKGSKRASMLDDDTVGRVRDLLNGRG